MRLHVRLLLGLPCRAMRGRRDLLIENLVLRQRSRSTRGNPSARGSGRRPRLLVGGRANLVAVAHAAASGPARHGGSLAPHCLAPVLDVEESWPPTGTSSDRS